jgi:DNA polymerase iota
VLVLGEDLSPFRDVSKRLYTLLRSYAWSGKIERLGLDEMFLDVTDMVAYNVELLNKNNLETSYFCLSRTNPEHGFEYDARSFAGCVQRGGGDGDAAASVQDTQEEEFHGNPLYMRLLVASHLAHYLRLKIEEEGYTTACGIATNKLLAKLVGSKNKPRNQTTLLALGDDDVFGFMDDHKLRKVPGIGSKITRILEGVVLGKEVEEDMHSMECSVTVHQARTHPSLQTPSVLERLLGGPGSERGLASKVWALLHGVDDTEVKPARDVPTQISIEDTYKGLNEPAEITRELSLISASLLRRMHVDLIEEGDSDHHHPKKWLAYPKTLRLTTRPYASLTDGKPYNWARASKSVPLPSFVFSLTMGRDQIVDKLVGETLRPLFAKLNPAPRGWNTGLINICVTNMANGNDGGSIRDIGTMFRQQDQVLREFTVYDTTPLPAAEDGPSPYTQEPGSQSAKINNTASGSIFDLATTTPLKGVMEEDTFWEIGNPECEHNPGDDDYNDDDNDDDGAWDEHDDGQPSSQESEALEKCALCGHRIPRFAVAAHARFHDMELDG